MTTLPRSGSAGTWPTFLSGMVRTTRSAAAASSVVAARACGPRSSARSWRVSGPRLLLRTTSCPASTASRATVLPMCPLPMSPMVVMATRTAGIGRSFRSSTASSRPRSHPERTLVPDRRTPGGATIEVTGSGASAAGDLPLTSSPTGRPVPARARASQPPGGPTGLRGPTRPRSYADQLVGSGTVSAARVGTVRRRVRRRRCVPRPHGRFRPGPGSRRGARPTRTTDQNSRDDGHVRAPQQDDRRPAHRPRSAARPRSPRSSDRRRPPRCPPRAAPTVSNPSVVVVRAAVASLVRPANHPMTSRIRPSQSMTRWPRSR